MTRRAVLVSWHYYRSRRKAGFHFIAEELAAMGWDVVFMTAGISWLSWVGRNPRFVGNPIFQEANRLVPAAPGIASYVWLTPFHPLSLRRPLLDRLTAPLVRRYADLPLGKVRTVVRNSDLIIFESTPGLLLVPRFRRLAPRARLAYRVSDDLRHVPFHPVVHEAEAAAAPLFDVISVPSKPLLERFRHLPQARLDFHGLRKDLFDRPSPDPYPAGFEKNVVFVGVFQLDRDLIRLAADAFPRWAFHVIGRFDDLPRAPNIVAHGEMPFESIVPWLQHADVGLQAIEPGGASASYSDSLKVIQYTYCRLPIVAPEHVPNWRPNVFYYRPGDRASIERALRDAAAFDRSKTSLEGIRSWREVAEGLAGRYERQA